MTRRVAPGLRLLTLLTLACLFSAFLSGCDGEYKRIASEDNGYWVGFDLPKGMVRSGGGWNRTKNSSYILKPQGVNLSHTRPDFQVREAIKMLGVDPEPGGKTHLQLVRDLAFGMENWRRLLSRVSSPELTSERQVIQTLERKAKELSQRYEKNPTFDDNINKKLLNDISTSIESLVPQTEELDVAYNIASVDYFANFSLEEMELEERDVDLAPCQIARIGHKGDTNVYALYPIDEQTLYLFEFREVESNDLESHLDPLIGSVRIGLLESTVQGDNPINQLRAMIPKTSHKANRLIFLLGFFCFCTVLPASVSAYRNYPGHGGGADRRKECGVAVRKAVSRTSGCFISAIAGLVCLGIFSDISSGKSLSFGLILVAFLGLLFTGLFWMVTLIAAYGAGAGAEKGASFNHIACVAYASGGAVAGALAVLLVFFLSGF